MMVPNCILPNAGDETSFFTSGGNLRRRRLRRLKAFLKITPTRWCGNGCPHVRSHPGLTNLEFGRVFTFALGHFYLLKKNHE